MDAETIKPFLKYTISMFREMYNFTPTYNKAYVQRDIRRHKWDISGVIGIMGDTEGIFVIRLKRKLAFKLLNQSNLVAETSKDITNMITGMVAEFANIICGNALNIVSEKNVNLTVPFTIQGTDHTVTWPAKGRVIAIPFNTPHGSFEIQINISS